MTFLSGWVLSSTGADGGALCASASVMLVVGLLHSHYRSPFLLLFPKLFYPVLLSFYPDMPSGCRTEAAPSLVSRELELDSDWLGGVGNWEGKIDRWRRTGKTERSREMFMWSFWVYAWISFNLCAWFCTVVIVFHIDSCPHIPLSTNIHWQMSINTIHQEICRDFMSACQEHLQKCTNIKIFYILKVNLCNFFPQEILRQ